MVLPRELGSDSRQSHLPIHLSEMTFLFKKSVCKVSLCLQDIDLISDICQSSVL